MIKNLGFLIPFIKKSIITVKKNTTAIIIILLFIITFLISLPEILFSLYVDKNDIERKINKLLAASDLAVSYDGFSTSFYGDIVIYGLKISNSIDFSKNKTFLEASEVKIPVKWQGFNDFYAEYSNIMVNKSTFIVWIENSKLSDILLKQISFWLNEYHNFEIIFNNAKFLLKYESKGYEKESWEISNVIVKIIKNQETNQISLAYNDSLWGNGNIKIIPEINNSGDFIWFENIYQLEFNKLPLENISWYFKPKKIKTGMFSGNLEVVNLSRKNNYKILGNIRLQNLSITEDEINILKVPLLNTSIQYIENNDYHSAVFVGSTETHNFSFQYEKNQKDLWPSTIKLEMKENSFNGQLVQINEFEISGIKDLSVDLSIPEEKDNYRNIKSYIKIENGSFVKNQKSLFLINDLELVINKNNYRLISKFMKNKSLVDITLEGQLNNFKSSFSESVKSLRNPKSKYIKYDIVCFSGNHSGSLISSELYMSDLKELEDYLIKKWQSNVIRGLNEGWRESKIRDREWFLKALWKNKLNMNLNFNKVFTSSSENINLSGKFDVFETYAKFNLKDELQNNVKNSFDFEYIYAGNYPFFRGNINFSSKNENNILENWIPGELLKKYDYSEISYSFKSGGERAFDIFDTHTGNGHFEFSNGILGSYFNDKDITKNWNNIKGEIRTYRNRGSLVNIFCVSDEKYLYAHGRWVTDLFFKQWTFDHRESNIPSKM
ncbi:MAG: hypothetical protein OEZ22_04360 [Spirochaetia bacterium]|nr:hypothetical protein [Spirochaetia bacterium]